MVAGQLRQPQAAQRHEIEGHGLVVAAFLFVDQIGVVDHDVALTDLVALAVYGHGAATVSNVHDLTEVVDMSFFPPATLFVQLAGVQRTGSDLQGILVPEQVMLAPNPSSCSGSGNRRSSQE